MSCDHKFIDSNHCLKCGQCAASLRDKEDRRVAFLVMAQKAGQQLPVERTLLAGAPTADLQSKLEAITQAAAGALGFLPRNDPGARMAAERIERVLGEIGAASEVPKRQGCPHGFRYAAECPECYLDIEPVADFGAALVGIDHNPQPANEPRAIVVGSVWAYDGDMNALDTVTELTTTTRVSFRLGDGSILSPSEELFRERHTWVSDP